VEESVVKNKTNAINKTGSRSMNGFGLGVGIITAMVMATSLTACLPQDEGGTVTQNGGNTSSSNPDFHSTPDPVNPTPTPPIPPTIPSPINSQPQEGIWIDSGALATQDPVMHLDIFKFEALKMKISLNGSCDGGLWQDYAETATVALTDSEQNRMELVSVRFTDYDQAPSGCFGAAILHDNKGPDILFTKYPLASIKEGEATQVIYDVTDAGVGVTSVTCTLNGVERPCASGRNIVDIPGAAAGVYTFAVNAVDYMGNANHNQISWQVTSVYRDITHDIHVNEYRKWDILFVIDNSGSMEYEQKSMANRTRNFLSVLHGLDWQIGVTTTDPRNINLGDGRFVPLTGRSGEYLLNSTMNEDQSQATLSQTLQRPEVGSGSEQAIYATYRVVERSQTAGSIQSQFFRQGAHFAVVLISDEDESDNQMKNDPQSLLSLVHNTFNGQKNFLFNSIITIPGDKACASTYGYSYGERFKVMTDLTSGVVGSVCASDYASQMTGIAEKIRAMAQTFTLSCVPVAGTTVTITRDGAAVTDPYTLDGVKLSFAQSILPGDYRLTYHCLKE
jgi:hypothetical protein